MPEKEDHLGRKAWGPDYNNPALSQILQRLSELPYQEAPSPMRESATFPLQNQHTTSINNAAHIVDTGSNYLLSYGSGSNY
jgi:hypothetical protein